MAIVRVIDEEILGCKTLAFDEHALTRMAERDVTEDEVIDVLRSPERTGLPTQPNRFRYRKSFAGRSIDVVFEHDPTQLVVITVVA
jgi:hypothetical protein